MGAGALSASEYKLKAICGARHLLYDRVDEKLIAKHGRRKAFYTGGNSTCHGHICTHYNLYKERCQMNNITKNHHGIPPHILLAERKAETKPKLSGGQTTLDGKFAKAKSQTQMFSGDDVLKSIAEFIVCDDQVSCIVDVFGN